MCSLVFSKEGHKHMLLNFPLSGRQWCNVGKTVQEQF